MSKRIEILQKRIEEIQSQEKSSFGFGLGWLNGGESVTKEDMEKKDEQIAALEEQLTIKNEETTQAHEQNFELKKKFNKDIDDLNDKISEMEKDRQTKEIEHQNLIQGKIQLTNELNSLKEEKRQLNMQ